MGFDCLWYVSVWCKQGFTNYGVFPVLIVYGINRVAVSLFTSCSIVYNTHMYGINKCALIIPVETSIVYGINKLDKKGIILLYIVYGM